MNIFSLYPAFVMKVYPTEWCLSVLPSIFAGTLKTQSLSLSCRVFEFPLQTLEHLAVQRLSQATWDKVFFKKNNIYSVYKYTP